MKRIMTLVLTLILVASFTVGALGAVDLQEKPRPEVTVKDCLYWCVYNEETNECCCLVCCPGVKCFYRGPCTVGTGCLQQ